MMEQDRLPRRSKNGKIFYELEFNVLRVWKVAPSMAHDAAANALHDIVLAWSHNHNMAGLPSLRIFGASVSNLTYG